MQMSNLTFDTDRHHYAFGRFDRILIETTPYKSAPHGHNEEGWLLEIDDASGRYRSFTHPELSRLGSGGANSCRAPILCSQ